MANDYDMAAGVAKKKLEYQLGGNYREAVRIAAYLVKTHFPDNLDWQPLPTLSGVLSQIDNMICAWKPRTTTPVANEEVEQRDFDWALCELADGWISNDEREGEYGFYQNARRVLKAVTTDEVDRLRAWVEGLQKTTLQWSEENIQLRAELSEARESQRQLQEGFQNLNVMYQAARAKAIGECCDKAKAMAAAWDDEAGPESFDVAESHYAYAARELLTALESLTQQQRNDR